mgnify:FL=1
MATFCIYLKAITACNSYWFFNKNLKLIQSWPFLLELRIGIDGCILQEILCFLLKFVVFYSIILLKTIVK